MKEIILSFLCVPSERSKKGLEFSMEKNYYQILEVDQNASPEIIKKAYNTLVKKYHPDLQSDSMKIESEKRIKLINEAYEILSNNEKRNEYDSTLVNNYISQEKYDILFEENEKLKNIINQLKEQIPNSNNFYSTNSTIEDSFNPHNGVTDKSYYDRQYAETLKKAYYDAYNDAYIQDLKNRGYKIKYKKTFKDHLKSIFSISLSIFIFWLLWHLPFVRNFFNDNILISNLFNIH